MTEVTLFIIVGGIAVAAAVLMLLSSNAVHSALSLIVVMVCLAFLFLMLDAPFLAMIQITVYAGAIMVLFLFVIMLLGAEKLMQRETQFRWFTPLVIVLALALLGGAYYAISQSKIDLVQTTPPRPMLRVVNGAPDAGTISVTANDRTVATDVAFRQASDFVTLDAGAYTLTVTPAGSPAVTLPVQLQDGAVQTLVAFGGGTAPSLRMVSQDLTTVDGEGVRLTVFNAYTAVAAVTVVDMGENHELDLGKNAAGAAAINDRIAVDSVARGQQATITLPAGAAPLAFMEAGRADEGGDLIRLPNLDLGHNRSDLIVLTGERLGSNNTVQAVAPLFDAPAQPTFGGPEGIGEALFTGYLLPFEMVSLLLLAAMVGAIILTHREGQTARQRMGSRRRVARSISAAVSLQVGHDVATSTAPEPPALPAEHEAGD